MPDTVHPPQKRIIDPIDRILEVLFGLIMVLTFTGSLSAAEAGREDIRIMLIGALGCNIAWGLIDGLFYLMGRLAERGQAMQTLRALREARDPETGQRLVSDSLPSLIAANMTPDDLEALRVRLIATTDPDSLPRLTNDDYFGAAGVCLLVIITTFPVAIPFLVMSDAAPALRVSNAIAVTLMFISGYSLGKLSDLGRWKTGLGMVVLGIALVLITIALGG
jgi:hypothetical protein